MLKLVTTERHIEPTFSDFTMKLLAKATIAVLMALLPTANTYVVSLFKQKGCDTQDLGAECRDIDDFTCCVGPKGQLFVSVGQDGHWAYSTQNDDECGVILGNDEDCFSVDNGLEVISGGSVLGIVSDALATTQTRQRKAVTADTWFYRNGTVKYALPVESEDGKKYADLEDWDARVNFIISQGKRFQTEG